MWSGPHSLDTCNLHRPTPKTSCIGICTVKVLKISLVLRRHGRFVHAQRAAGTVRRRWECGQRTGCVRKMHGGTAAVLTPTAMPPRWSTGGCCPAAAGAAVDDCNVIAVAFAGVVLLAAPASRVLSARAATSSAGNETPALRASSPSAAKASAAAPAPRWQSCWLQIGEG